MSRIEDPQLIGEAYPYLKIIEKTFPGSEYDEKNGFVVCKRDLYLDSLSQIKSDIELSSERVVGDTEIIDFLREAVSMKEVIGLAVSARPSFSTLYGNLDFNVIKLLLKGKRRSEVSPTFMLPSYVHRLQSELERNQIRLAASVSYSVSKEEEDDITPDLLAAKQRVVLELLEEMPEEFKIPGELPFTYHYLLRID